MSKVIVVGAGLAGLTAATYLQNSGLDVAVLEKSERPGGRVKSDYVDDFILDHGFQVINSGYSEIKALDLLSGLDFSPISPNIRLAHRDNQIVGLSALAKTVGSVSGRVREKIAFAQFLATPINPDRAFSESAHSFPTLFANILAPFLTGVFLCNPEVVSASVAQQIIRSFIAGRPGVPTQGVSAFSEKLASGVRDIQYGSEVKSITQGVVRGNFGALSADHIVVATPASITAQLLNHNFGLTPLSSTTWYHATDEGLAHSKFLAVNTGSPIVNSVVISEVSKSYAPAGKHLIASTALSSLSEKELHTHLDSLWGADTRRWDLVGRYEISESLHLHKAGASWERSPEFAPGIYLAGDYCNLPSQNGAMKSGRLVAEEIIRSLK